MRTAVIGAGHISRQHLACLRELPGVDIAAICDISRSVAEAMADRFSVGAWFTDHKAMLEELKPDVVHVTTPPSSHFALACDAIDAGAHVVLEKPATARYEDTIALLERASARNVALVEDYNYLFNTQVQEILRAIDDGSFGPVIHMEAFICLQIAAPDSAFADANAPHPVLAMDGGAIADFLPHLASLAHAFVGGHRAVRTSWAKRSQGHPLPSDEFRALVEGERGTAVLGFSAHAQPEMFSLMVLGAKMRAAANLFEPRLTIERLLSVPKPLMPLVNGLQEARQVRRAAYGGLWRKLSGGPGAYEGLWELLRRTYAALREDAEPPVTHNQVHAVNRLVRDLTRQENRL